MHTKYYFKGFFNSLKFFFINFDKKLEYMSLTDPIGNFDNLNDADRFHAEEMLLSRAFENSYLIITKQKTFDQMLESTKGNIDGAILAHDPSSGITDDELDNMMHYFIDEEEYEKCAKIRDIIELRTKKNATRK